MTLIITCKANHCLNSCLLVIWLVIWETDNCLNLCLLVTWPITWELLSLPNYVFMIDFVNHLRTRSTSTLNHWEPDLCLISCLLVIWLISWELEITAYFDDDLCRWTTLLSHSALINSLWPSDTIWWHRSRWTLAQVMACCLMAPSHYLNQCWLITKVLCIIAIHLRAVSQEVHMNLLRNKCLEITL